MIDWKEKITCDVLSEKAAELKHGGFKPGSDDMTAKGARLWIMVNAVKLLASIRSGQYEPMPAVGF